MDFKGAASDGLHGLGFAVVPVAHGDRRLLAVADPLDHITGRGIYVVDTDAQVPIVVQAPHRYKDRRTGRILSRLMREVPFAAAALNSVPRWYDDPAGERRDADLAHLDATYFNAFTRAFAVAQPTGLVVQLHGFAQDKRTSDAGRGAAAIISNGSKTPDARTTAIAHCLRRRLDPQVLLYPHDVGELGATTNANGRMLRQIGFTGFLHVEMSAALRDRLATDTAARGAFAACLLEAVR